MGEAERRTVRLERVPIEVARAVVVYRNDMIRELQLIEVGREQGIEEPSQLYDLAEALRSDLEWLRNELAPHTVWTDPDADETSWADVTIEVLPDAARRMRRVLERFEELNQLSRHGELLTEEATAEMMAVVRWVVDEISGQLLEGRPPRPLSANIV